MTNQVKHSLPLQDILTFSWCASSLESRQLYSEGNLRNKGKTKNQFLDNNNNLTSDQNMILYPKQEYSFNHFSFHFWSTLQFVQGFLPFLSILSWPFTFFAHSLPFSITTCTCLFSLSPTFIFPFSFFSSFFHSFLYLFINSSGFFLPSQTGNH